MTVVQLRAECMARELSDEGSKNELQQNLKDHLKDIQRVPALLVNDQDKTMDEIHLGREITIIINVIIIMHFTNLNLISNLVILPNTVIFTLFH